MGRSKPNVLLVVFDTARADAFEPYGAPPGSSPTVAQLGREGSVHPRCYSTACWTVPAHGSLFSGRLPRTAGLGHAGRVDPSGDFRRALRELGDGTLPGVMRREGYDSAAISANAWVSAHIGFDTGFDRFTFIPSERRKRMERPGRREAMSWYRQALRATMDDGAAAIEAHLARWIDDRRRAPFFWFVNLMECHAPYLPPKPYALGAASRLLAAHDARQHLGLFDTWKACIDEFDLSERKLRRIRKLYAAAIRQMDDWLARVLSRLDRHHLLDDTQVIITSDHGENLGEQDLRGHAFSLDDRLLRVPLVAAGPFTPLEGNVASLVDVPRWIAEQCDVSDHPFEAPDDVGRVPVAQFDAPGQPGSEPVEAAVRRWGLTGERAERARRRLCASFACATDGTLKLFRRDGAEEVVDLTTDPLEERPMIVDAGVETTHGTRLDRLRRALDRAAADEPVPAPTAPDPVPADELASLQHQMRILGYL